MIQTYTLPYLKIIKTILGTESKIILVTTGNDCVRQKKQVDTIEVVSIKNGIVNYFQNFLFLKSILKIEEITFLHNWCTPAGIYTLPLYKKNLHQLVLDSFEPHAEAMVENGEWKRFGIKFKLLFYIEKQLAKKAHHVIFAAQGMQDYVKEKFRINLTKYFIKPACVDLIKFSPTIERNNNLMNAFGLNEKIVAVYAGKFGGIYLDKEVFDFFEACFSHWGNSFKALILTQQNKSDVEELMLGKKMLHENIVIKSVSFSEIENYLALADFAICPVKPVPTKHYCSPIKNGEYWAMGLPVVITKNISTDSELIEKNNCGYVLKELTHSEYKNAIEKINVLLNEKNHKSKIRELAETQRNFNLAQAVYSQIYI